jgi:hypothetical protein
MKVTKVTVPLLLGATINLVQDLRPVKDGGGGGKNVLSIVFGSVALFAGLTAVGEFLDWDIASALAILYLLHTLLTDGQEAIDWFAKLTASI